MKAAVLSEKGASISQLYQLESETVMEYVISNIPINIQGSTLR